MNRRASIEDIVEEEIAKAVYRESQDDRRKASADKLHRHPKEQLNDILN